MILSEPISPRFEIIVQRLCDQAANLAKTFDDIDQGEEQQQMVESFLVVGHALGLRLSEVWSFIGSMPTVAERLFEDCVLGIASVRMTVATA